MSAVPPVPIPGTTATSPSTAFTSAKAALFILSSFLALTFSHSSSARSFPTADGATTDAAGDAVEQPEDSEDAKRMVVEEQEEELLDEASFGLTVPAGAPRPALIIVMVSGDGGLNYLWLNRLLS
jgi:hypothetical protein